MRNFSLSIVIGLLFAAGAAAHPLGNFSVNQFARIETGADQIKVHQVLDLAEIPTLQLAGTIDTDKDGTYSQTELDAYLADFSTGYVTHLGLTVDGRTGTFGVIKQSIGIVPGEGGLATLRIEWSLVSNLDGGLTAGRVNFRNTNFADRIGWNEIVVTETAAARVFDSTAFSTTLSDELRKYPLDLISAPLSERTAEFSISNGEIAVAARPLSGRDGRPVAIVERDRLAELIQVPEVTPMIALFGLLVAFGLGAAHAMSPGHGKTVVGAYLVGSKGTTKHALFLGLTVTITHTLGVFALGLITLFASNYILPEKIMPFLGFVSGLMVFFIGVSLFKERLWAYFGWKRALHQHDHDHSHEHGQDHDHTRDGNHEGEAHSHGDGLTHTHGGSTHTHAVPDDLSWKSLLTLGISGGLLPCPSALVLMLAAISAGKVGYGLILTIAFSFGLAATLTIVGLVFLNVRNLFGRTSLSANPVFRVLPVASAFVVAAVGAVICYNSLA
ncbi:MAG: sulfite exporter TauE/SafE family protein [Pyrinomonadaceae bacterium]